jgi:hypothetical protein
VDLNGSLLHTSAGGRVISDYDRFQIVSRFGVAIKLTWKVLSGVDAWGFVITKIAIDLLE